MHTKVRYLIPRLDPFLMAVLAVLTITLAGVLNAATFSAMASGVGEREPNGYGWNLKNDALPLINLPEHINGRVDLSLTYSMDQFEFPILQSLYYNARAGKFVLMVIPKADQYGNQFETVNRRTEFVDLVAVQGMGQPAINRRLGWRLTDQGRLKLLSTSDGTVFTFTSFADGELRCNQIKNHNGEVIDLIYTSDSSIQLIADSRGRRVNFNYINQDLTAITQSWLVNAAERKRTWVIGHETHHTHRSTPSAGRLTTGVTAKRVPSNAIHSTYSTTMAASDLQLAAIFGGPGAIAAANGFEPEKLGRQYPVYRGDLMGDDGRIRRGHLSFAMHLYGSEDGTNETALYVPAGFISHSDQPTPTDAVVTFYYPRLGNLTNVTLAVFHVTDFQLTHEENRVRIGKIGGPGGSISCYKHSHLEFYRGDTGLPRLSARTELRVDPATVFTSTIALRR